MQRIKKWWRAHTILATLIVAVSLAGSAIAYYLNQGSGSASTTGAIATHTSAQVPVSAFSASLPDSTPIDIGQSRQVQIDISNTTGQSLYLGHVADSITGLPAGCPADSFTFPNVPINATQLTGVNTQYFGTITFVNRASEDQAACSGGTFTLNLNLVSP
jgi:hypothetical protein